MHIKWSRQIRNSGPSYYVSPRGKEKGKMQSGVQHKRGCVLQKLKKHPAGIWPSEFSHFIYSNFTELLRIYCGNSLKDSSAHLGFPGKAVKSCADWEQQSPFERGHQVRHWEIMTVRKRCAPEVQERHCHSLAPFTQASAKPFYTHFHILRMVLWMHFIHFLFFLISFEIEN